MTLPTHGRTLQQTIAAIEALDLGMIKFKATRREDGYGWSDEHANRMEVAYKRYLILHAKYPDLQLAPEQDVDRFWHLHILDTRKYAADCEATFGHFLHHFPYLGLRGEGDEQALQDAFATMQRLLQQEFGEPMGAVPHEAAWCSVEPTTTSAAWCSVEPTTKVAAWCSVEPTTKAAAWCSVEPTTRKAAWCSVEPTPAKQDAAWCSVEPTTAGAAPRTVLSAEIH